MPLCRYCKKPIVFAKQGAWNQFTRRFEIKPGASPTPIDAEPVDDGDVVLELDSYEILTSPAAIDAAKVKGKKLHKRHFSTCANAEEAKEAAAVKRKREARDRGYEALHGPLRRS